MNDTVPDVRTGEKWGVAQQVKDMESSVLKDIAGTTQAEAYVLQAKAAGFAEQGTLMT